MSVTQHNSSIFLRIHQRPRTSKKRESWEVHSSQPLKKQAKSFLEFSKGSKNPTESSFHLGSTMPKPSNSINITHKAIKPPTEILANSIIKASKDIEKQSGSIHWNEINSTLQDSKKNILRLREIYLPIKDFQTSLWYCFIT